MAKDGGELSSKRGQGNEIILRHRQGLGQTSIVLVVIHAFRSGAQLV
jgi:hypothetical protein